MGPPYDDKIAAEERISAHKLTAIETHGDRYVRRLCMNCVQPTCVSVCPVGALQKTALGPVIYDADKCMGCRYCMQACPFQVPTYEWSSRLPRMRKCDMCYERQSAGKLTACAEACPTGATICGDRDELIAEARRRIAEKPDQYLPRIYGLEEVGGTSVLVPFRGAVRAIGLAHEPAAGPAAAAHLAGPGAHAGCGLDRAVLLGGIWWITNRREEVAAAEGGPQAGASMRASLAFFKITVWRVDFRGHPAERAGGPVRPVRLRPGRRHQSERQLPVGPLDRLRRAVRALGLAAGGFTLVAIVHIFNLKRYKPVLRLALLTAFLGYSFVVVALAFDLGRPDRIWHPLVMWNPHSVMFEVAWCVTLYTTVLFLEFVPVVCERFGWHKPLRGVQRISVPLMILGVLLSTLHQCSLGSLFLIVPEKLYPLWYTPLLPVLFFVSAICVGLAMTIFESWHSSRAFGRALELPLLASLGRVLAVVLRVYLWIGASWIWCIAACSRCCSEPHRNLAVRAGDRPDAGAHAAALPAARPEQPGTLYVCAVMVVFGFIANRLNVGITGLEASSGTHYIPKWSEVAVTLSIVALGFAIFRIVRAVLPHFRRRTRSGQAGGRMRRRKCRWGAGSDADEAAGDSFRLGLAAKLAVCVIVSTAAFFVLFGYLNLRVRAPPLRRTGGAVGRARHRRDPAQHALRDAAQRPRGALQRHPGAGQRAGHPAHPHLQQGRPHHVLHRRARRSTGWWTRAPRPATAATRRARRW